MITSEEMAPLRVPLASLPGLDPVGLRVCFNAGEATADGICAGVWTHNTGLLHVCGGALRRDVALIDLADAATADRVARWMAGRTKIVPPGCTAPEWGRASGGGWGLRHPSTNTWTPWKAAAYWSGECPTLAGLDPTDGRSLPDGSRYVDRIALARVAVHLGSGG